MKVTEYKEEFGEIRLPDGFADELRGKTVEEQMLATRSRIFTAVRCRIT